MLMMEMIVIGAKSPARRSMHFSHQIKQFFIAFKVATFFVFGFALLINKHIKDTNLIQLQIWQTTYLN